MMRSRAPVAGLLMTLWAPLVARAAVDPGPDGGARPERTRWRSAPADADARAAVLMLTVDRALDANDLPGALEMLGRLTRVRPLDPTVFNNFGFVKVQLGDLAGAADAFRKSVELDPGYAQGAVNLALALVDLGRLEEASRSLQPWAGRLGEQPALGVLLARIEKARGLDASARGLIDRLLAVPEVPPRVLFEIANLLGDWKDPRAEATFRRVMTMEPAMIGATLSLASILRTSGRATEARAVLDELERREPEHPSLLLERGLLHASEGRLEEAVFDLDRAVAKRPGLTIAAIRAAKCLVELGRSREALMRLDPVLNPGRTVSPSDREAAVRLKARISGAFPKAIRPAGVDVREFRRALERHRDARPELETLVWSGLSRRPEEHLAVVAYHIRGAGPVELSLWVGERPWNVGVRPRNCPGIRSTPPDQPGVLPARQALEEAFPGIRFDIEVAGTGSGPTGSRVTAIGRPDPRVWLRIQASGGGGGGGDGAGVAAPAGLLPVDWARRLIPIALEGPPAATLEAMRAISPDPSPGPKRVWLVALLAPPRGPPVVLNVELHPDVDSLLARTPGLVRPGGLPARWGGGIRRESARWFHELPCVEVREESPVMTGIPSRSAMGQITVFVGRVEVGLASWSAGGIGGLVGTMHHVLRRMFPELTGSWK